LHRINDDHELLKFKDFQDPLTSNSKTLKALFGSQGRSRSWKSENYLSRAFNNLCPPCNLLPAAVDPVKAKIQALATALLT